MLRHRLVSCLYLERDRLDVYWAIIPGDRKICIQWINSVTRHRESRRLMMELSPTSSIIGQNDTDVVREGQQKICTNDKREITATHTHTKKEWADEAISWIRIHIILYFIFFVILSMVVASESRRSDFKGESWSNRPALIFEKNQQDYQHIQLSEFFSFERSFCWDLRVLERDIHSTYINTSISQSLNQVRVLRPTIPIFFHLPGGGSCVYFSPLIFLSF